MTHTDHKWKTLLSAPAGAIEACEKCALYRMRVEEASPIFLVPLAMREYVCSGTEALRLTSSVTLERDTLPTMAGKLTTEERTERIVRMARSLTDMLPASERQAEQVTALEGALKICGAPKAAGAGKAGGSAGGGDED